MKKMYIDSLSDYLKEQNISHREVAEFAGISTSGVSLILTGKRKPYPKNARKIAEFLGMKSGADEKGIYFYKEEIADKRYNYVEWVESLNDVDKGEVIETIKLLVNQKLKRGISERE